MGFALGVRNLGKMTRDDTWKGAPLKVKVSAVVLAIAAAVLLASLVVLLMPAISAMGGGGGYYGGYARYAAELDRRPKVDTGPNWLDRLIARVSGWWRRVKLAQEANRAKVAVVRSESGARTDLTQSVFPTTLLSILGWIAAADSRTTEDERQYADRTARRLGLANAEVAVALSLFERGSRTGFSPDKQLHKIKVALSERKDLRTQFVEHLLEGAFSDGQLTADENERVRHVALTLGVPEMELATMQAVASAGAT